MEQTLFAWVHLSDIHVGHGDPTHRWDQRLVLREVARDVAAARDEGLEIPAPDAILVTGDVAFSGNGVVRAPDKESREYEGAKAWLLEVAGKVGLSAKDVFVVPGNHDVNRGKDRDRATARLVKSLQDGSESLDEALANADDRKRLAQRMEAYLAFASGFAPACLGAAGSPEEQLYWSHRLPRARGLAVRLVGLNTALLSSGDADFGHLRLGHEQIARTLGDPPIADDGELVIVLSHHPFAGWLGDAKDATALLKRYAHLHLSGHVHEAEAEESRTGGSRHGFLRVVAGAAHADKQASAEIPAGHGYNFAAVVANERGELSLRVWPRKWSDTNRDFRQDVNNIPRGKKWAEHALPVRCAPLAAELPPIAVDTTPHGVVMLRPLYDAAATTRATPVATTPREAATPATPVELFYVYAPQDAEMLDDLATHLAPLETRGIIQTFDKRSLGPGADVNAAIAVHVESAKIFLVLVSPAFLVSDFFRGPLMDRALERAARGEAKVVPIYIKTCDWEETKLAALAMLPNVTEDVPGKVGKRRPVPVSKLDRDEVFRDVSVALRTMLELPKKQP